MTAKDSRKLCQDVAYYDFPAPFVEGNTELQKVLAGLRDFSAKECPLLVALSTGKNPVTRDICRIPCDLVEHKDEIIRWADIAAAAERAESMDFPLYQADNKFSPKKKYFAWLRDDMNEYIHPILQALFLICRASQMLCNKYYTVGAPHEILLLLIESNPFIESYCAQQGISTAHIDSVRCANVFIACRQYLNTQLQPSMFPSQRTVLLTEKTKQR